MGLGLNKKFFVRKKFLSRKNGTKIFQIFVRIPLQVWYIWLAHGKYYSELHFFRDWPLTHWDMTQMWKFGPTLQAVIVQTEYATITAVHIIMSSMPRQTKVLRAVEGRERKTICEPNIKLRLGLYLPKIPWLHWGMKLINSLESRGNYQPGLLYNINGRMKSQNLIRAWHSAEF
jgi:hypothetical protein